MTSMTPIRPELGAVKVQQRTCWAAGDHSRVGDTMQIVGETLCEAIDLRPGSRVLDVAAGNGSASLAAARRFCHVTSSDYVEGFLETGRQRAEALGLEIEFQLADAEALPFADESFDTVLSTFGAMFTPDQQRTADEMIRVCRSGGVIGMTNWAAEGFMGQLHATLDRYLPPVPGLPSPMQWAEELTLEKLFGAGVSIIAARRKVFTLRYLSFEHFLGEFRRGYGPMRIAFDALGDKAVALEADLRVLHERFNVAEPNAFVVPSEYAQVLITK